METIQLQEGKIMMTRLKDGTLGRFDFRGTDPNNYTLYIQFGEGKSWFNMSVFYTDKFKGSLNEINQRLEKFEIFTEIIKTDKKLIVSKGA